MRRVFLKVTLVVLLFYDFNIPSFVFFLYRFSDAPAGEGEALLKRPVIIHRAILGSVERFMAILTENFAGK